jgi:hypothetical protein
MSVGENLHFSQKFDCTEGFENCGSQGRTCNIANHALVFIICGLYRNLKQPMAYNFICGSSNAEVIVQYLKKVLLFCHNAELKIVVGVMGANNVTALKLLSTSKRRPLFRFYNQETATVYDPPHLLKCTRNLFLKCDVQLISEHLGNQLLVTAKWEHILKLYKLDKSRPFCQLYKLTDTHFNPTEQSAMKVNLAAQVMSHTVAASLNALVATGKDQLTVCYELYSVMKEVADENNEGNFSKSFSPEPSCSQTNIIVVIYYLRDSISIYKLHNTNVFRVIKNV